VTAPLVNHEIGDFSFGRLFQNRTCYAGARQEGAMKIGLFAVLLTCALMPAGFAATITMSPPDLQNKAPIKPSSKPSVKPSAPNATPPVRPAASMSPSPAAVPVKPQVAAQSVARPSMPQAVSPSPATVPAKPKVAAQPVARPSLSHAVSPSRAVVQAEPKVVALAKAQTPQPKKKIEVRAKADCPCDCPNEHKARSAAARPAPHPSMRRSYVQDYRYADAAPVRWRAWRGEERNGAGPMSNGPPPRYEPDGLRIDNGGWMGGVGTAPEGGGGGGFVDGYGQVHFANGGSVQNGPTYNSYGQSFQYNPSQAGPFQPRPMGGFAPPGSR
jgi:hypothetical protein